MDDLDGLRNALALIDAAIDRREAELKELLASRRHLIALVPQGSMLPPADTPVPPRAASERPRQEPREEPGERLPSGVSKASKVVLRRHARPMDADELSRALVAAGHKYEGTLTNLAATVRSVLGREVREKGESTELIRMGRGKFGLRGWEIGVQQALLPADELEQDESPESETA